MKNQINGKRVQNFVEFTVIKICLSILDSTTPPPPSGTIFNAIWGNAKNKNWNVRYRQVKLSNGAKINVRYNQVSAIAVSAI